MKTSMELDPTANLKRMSKGMKQKTAIVAALMADPEVSYTDKTLANLPHFHMRYP